MRRGRYIGKIEELKGKTALLLPGQHSSSEVRAQFNDKGLVYDGKHLGFGWHSFQKSSFELIGGAFNE